jgi:hypothetical protein
MENNMDMVLVNKQALIRVLNYIMDEEEHDYLECKESDWTEDELKQHIYTSLLQLEKDFNAGK